MCGIAGMMSLDGSAPPSDVLKTLSGLLAHRGPDGSGCHIDADVAMVQTRLAIIDLDGGDQPIYARRDEGSNATEGKPVAIIANGEIYNYVELRASMGVSRFATGSDCEPPLHLYLEHGFDFVTHLRGMYAIAIHDPDHGRLVLARDWFGIKPLYYAETDAGFVFASEPGALLRSGLVAAIERPAARDELLQLQFTTGAETIYQGIFRVLPGEVLVVERGRIITRRQHSALPQSGPVATGATAALYDLDSVLNDTVGVHQRADVDYAMFLSGGIDSSVLLAMMSRLNVNPVQAYTAGFSETSVHDERARARAVAKELGARHVEVEFGADDFWSLLPAIAAAMDDPVADYAILPTWKLAAAAHADGYKVVLTGEGGDELFAGYSRYRGVRRPWPFKKSMRQKGILDGLGLLRDENTGWRDGIAIAEAEQAIGGRTKLQSAQAADCADWLPNDLLTKVDRCLMAHGVEGRVPFLDPEMAAFAYRLPDHLKIHHRRGKWLLRRWLQTALPVAKPFARKRGFTVPVGEWIREKGQTLGPLVANDPAVVALCHGDGVRGIFTSPDKRAGKAAWTLLFYALWHRAHISGHIPAGDVFETLSG